jgi:hypothetical protein
MAQAHTITRNAVAQAAAIGVKLAYRSLFVAALKDCHKMSKTEVNPVEAWKAQAIADAQARIAELEAIDTTEGYIVVVGDNIRLPMDEVQGKWCRVERASIFWYREDAQRFAGRIVNGNGEAGQVVKKIDQIAWEISEQNKLIESLKTGF